MKVLIILALVAAASAVPMQVYLSEKVRVVDAPALLAAAEQSSVKKVQFVQNPIFDAEPVHSDPHLAVKIVDAPVEPMIHAVELPAAPLPVVNLQAPSQSLVFSSVELPEASFQSIEKQTDIDQVRFVESIADDIMPMNLEAAMNVNAPEAVRIVEAPVHFETPAASELETIRVVRPSTLDMAREAVQIVA